MKRKARMWIGEGKRMERKTKRMRVKTRAERGTEKGWKGKDVDEMKERGWN